MIMATHKDIGVSNVDNKKHENVLALANELYLQVDEEEEAQEMIDLLVDTAFDRQDDFT